MPRQDSLYEQLKDLRVRADTEGMYDAADFLTQHIQKIEQRVQATPGRGRASGLTVVDRASTDGVTVTATQRIKDGCELLFVDTQDKGGQIRISWNGQWVVGQAGLAGGTKGRRTLSDGEQWIEGKETPAGATKGRRTLLDGGQFGVRVEIWLSDGRRHLEVSGEARHGLQVYLEGKMVYSRAAVAGPTEVAAGFEVGQP